MYKKNKNSDLAADRLFIRIIKMNPWIYDPKFQKIYEKDAKERMWMKLSKTIARYGLKIVGEFQG